MNTKVLIFLAFLAISVVAAKRSAEDEKKILDDYFANRGAGRNGRKGRSKDQEENVLKRFYEIEDHNERFKRGDESFEAKLNDFADLSEDEFKNYLGYQPPENEVIPEEAIVPLVNTSRSSRSALPDYWNWAEQGYVVQAVQNQGQCGSCYAFAAIAAIEGSMCRYHGKCVKLSEQEAMDCTNGCNGGWDTYVYDYTTKYAGATTRSLYSYLGYARTCSPASRARQPQSNTYMYKILPSDELTIRTYLYNYGPLFVAFYVHSNFNSYSSGIITTAPGSVLGGHAVLITGWGTANGVPYWIVKNSWGANWGEKGYFRILRGYNLARFEDWRVSFPWTK